MSSSTQPLKPVVDVYYNLGPVAAVRAGFNIGAIIGKSTAIPPSVRGIIFNEADELIDYGFDNDSPEVLAAQVYFSATSQPSSLYVGTWVTAETKATRTYDGSITEGNIFTVDVTDYTIGDGTGGTTTPAQLVTAVETAGGTAVYDSQAETISIAFEAATVGSGGSVSVALAVTKGTGSDVASVIDTPGFDVENALEAVQANRSNNSDWYALGMLEVLDKATADSISAYIESVSQTSTYFNHSNNTDVFNNVPGNLFETLKGKNYQRTIGTATVEDYTHIGIMGYAMGQTRDAAGTSYTLGLKSIPGVLPDNLSSTQISNIKGNFGNVYINRGSQYDLYEDGKVFSGAWYDEIIQLDKLVNRIQLNIMDLLVAEPKVAQTDRGLQLIIDKISEAVNGSVTTGFIAPGIWTSSDILELRKGDTLPAGYVIQTQSFADQPQADREARKAPMIYLAIKLAGAIQSVVVAINVNR